MAVGTGFASRWLANAERMIMNAIQEIIGQAGTLRKLLIDGQWVDAASGETFATINPSTGEVLAQVALGGAEDIDRAVAAARRAFEGPWRRVTPYERQRILLKFAELVEANFEKISMFDTLEIGAPISLTRGRLQRVLGLIRFYAGLTTAIRGDTIENSLPGEFFSYTLKEPVGVVGAISPWNVPTVASLWKICPVIATGCTMVLKPSELAVLTPLFFGELLLEAGLPAGVVNIVPGTGSVAGAALAAHLDVDKVAFTGSTLTGQKIIEASKGNIKRVSLELGGKSPDVIFADADLDAAVPGAAMAAFANSGQICSAGTRLLVQRPVYEEFVGRVAEYGEKLRLGDAADPQTQIGPLVSLGQLERVNRYLEIGRDEGVQIATGGSRAMDPGLAPGYFVTPTVLANVENTMRIAQEEIFGPVISAIVFDDLEEAAWIGNATQFGLGAGIWTRDMATAHQMAKALRAGTVWVNCYAAMDAAIPFGGMKMSGYGRESGVEHLGHYLETKSVVLRVG